MFLPPMNLCWKPHEHMFLENTAPLLDFLVEISSEILTIWQSIFPVVNSFEELSQLKSSNELTHVIEWVDSAIWGCLQMKIRTLSELFTNIQLNCRRTSKISTLHLLYACPWTSHRLLIDLSMRTLSPRVWESYEHALLNPLLNYCLFTFIILSHSFSPKICSFR